jgi:hypothetical protein
VAFFHLVEVRFVLGRSIGTACGFSHVRISPVPQKVDSNATKSAVLITYAPAFGRSVRWGVRIGAERKRVESWNGFLRARPNPLNPEPADTHVNPMAAYCSLIFPVADLVFLFS